MRYAHFMYAKEHARLLERIASLLRGAGREVPARVLRAEIPITDTAPLEWLHAQKAAQRWYWAERDGAADWAGAGAAFRLAGAPGASHADAADQCAVALAASSPGVRFLGGFRFDPDAPGAQPWESFPSYSFIVPRIECRRTAEGAVLACNVAWSPGMRGNEALAQLAADLRALRPPAPFGLDPLPSIGRRLDVPAFPKWREAVRTALEGCARGTLAKVVLARRTEFALAAPVDSCALLDRLSSSRAPCFAFLFQHAGDDAFLGATPELLYRREGRALRAEALAGTCARDPDSARDAALGCEFLRSDKERAEHRIVRTTLHADLRALCSDPPASEDEDLVVLPHLRHIVTRFRGVLADGVTDGRILARLHPTAAVGGDPRSAALDAIAALERFDRGWYAAPIGWIAHDAAEFAVAIRSGHLSGNRLTLYAGAGIVPGSDPAREWDENERKLAPFLKAFDGNGTRS